MGVWIEMGIADLCGNVWEVAPFVGVWIEISECVYPIKSLIVAPFVGVWIEICNIHICWCICIWSLPSWECGLKFTIGELFLVYISSLPSWECGLKSYNKRLWWRSYRCRSLRGSVD